MQFIDNDFDFNEYMTETENQEVRSSADYLADTLDLAFPDSTKPQAPSPMWAKFRDKEGRAKLSFKPGHVTLWAGINGHGKSMFLSQVTLDLIRQLQRVLVISVEMTPAEQLLRMCTQSFAGEPSKEYISHFHKLANDSLWIYNQQGAVQWKKVMAVMRYAQEKFGINHFVIDSLMKVVRGENDLDGQKEFIDALTIFAMAHRVHVHLVHHVRKGESEEKIPDKFDIRGSSSIIDQVDQIAIIFRDKRNEKALNDARHSNSVADPFKYTAKVKVVKNRHGRWEGMLGFFFDSDSNQYLETLDSKPIRYQFK